MSVALSVRIYSEDKNEQSAAAIETLLGKLLECFDGHTRVVSFEAEKDNWALHGNRWRAQKPDVRLQNETRALVRGIANELRKPSGHVVFHYDGDTLWADQAEAPLRADFTRVMRRGVREALDARTSARPRPERSRLPAPPLSDKEIEERLGRLIECAPFYSIEAWLYQATARAKELCMSEHEGRDVERFEAWGEDRELLDEVRAPKESVCLRDQHNAELAKRVPVAEVLAVGKSLAGFRDALRACPTLALRMKVDARVQGMAR